MVASQQLPRCCTKYHHHQHHQQVACQKGCYVQLYLRKFSTQHAPLLHHISQQVVLTTTTHVPHAQYEPPNQFAATPQRRKSYPIWMVPSLKAHKTCLNKWGDLVGIAKQACHVSTIIDHQLTVHFVKYINPSQDLTFVVGLNLQSCNWHHCPVTIIIYG